MARRIATASSVGRIRLANSGWTRPSSQCRKCPATAAGSAILAFAECRCPTCPAQRLAWRLRTASTPTDNRQQSETRHRLASPRRSVGIGQHIALPAACKRRIRYSREYWNVNNRSILRQRIARLETRWHANFLVSVGFLRTIRRKRVRISPVSLTSPRARAVVGRVRAKVPTHREEASRRCDWEVLHSRTSVFEAPLRPYSSLNVWLI